MRASATLRSASDISAPFVNQPSSIVHPVGALRVANSPHTGPEPSFGRTATEHRFAVKADVSNDIERFYSPTRRQSALRYVSPMDFEKLTDVS